MSAGLTDDEDIKVLLKGSLLWKIKGRQQQKQRLHRLQNDGMNIWFETRFKRAHSKHVFSILHIESVLAEGFQSEGLKIWRSPSRAPVLHSRFLRAKRKNLDLAAQTAEEAQRSLALEQGSSSWFSPSRIGVHQNRKHFLAGICLPGPFLTSVSTWIPDILKRADKNKDNKMSFKGDQKHAAMINIDMSDL
uniref:Uncharacterized protein n=1 Tax=Sphaerodactylus townsendi TaxID=933632 RepID=A0ACB8EU67_9SAUR